MAKPNYTLKDKTLNGLGNLIRLLPTGTVFIYQLLNPILTNNGHCTIINKYLSGILIALCGLSCGFSCFTDSYTDNEGSTHYGIATMKGLWNWRAKCNEQRGCECSYIQMCCIFCTVVNSGSFKRSQLVQFFDLREITSPPLPPNSIGNLVSIISSPIYEDKEELKLPNLVTDIKKSKNYLSATDNIVEENEFAIEMLDAYRSGEVTFSKRKCDLYISSSVCKFPFSQDLDFGFGNPIRSSIAKGPLNKFIHLMRTYHGGMEAFVNLNEQEMSVFEHDKQLLEFATPNINEDFCNKEEQ